MLPEGQQICLLTKTYRIIKNHIKSILMICNIFFIILTVVLLRYINKHYMLILKTHSITGHHGSKTTNNYQCNIHTEWNID